MAALPRQAGTQPARRVPLDGRAAGLIGVTWTAADHAHITARYTLGETPVQIDYTLDSDGRIRSLVFDRWGDPDNTGTFAWHRFGGQITGYRTFAGLTIPSDGRVGWHFGTGRWPEGEFSGFRLPICDLSTGSFSLRRVTFGPAPAE